MAALSGVDVIISFVAELDNSNSQLNLFHAAEATGVKRFIPSEWAMDVQRFDDCRSIYEFKKKFRHFFASQDKNEYTLISNGLFRDYLLPKGAKVYCNDVVIQSISRREKQGYLELAMNL
ncbi:unnamed protein product [Umbelopsis vinacea]